MRTATGLSRDLVVGAAAELIGAVGLSAFSMRRLAAALDVKVMSLYTYVSGKPDVLGEVAGLHISDLEIPAPADSWQESVVRTFLDLHDRMVAHPVVAQVFAMQPVDSAPAHEIAEAVLGLLDGNGFDQESAVELFIALGSQTVGYTLNGLARHELAGRLADLEGLSEDRYPNLRAAAPLLTTWRSGGLGDTLRRIVDTHPRSLPGS